MTSTFPITPSFRLDDRRAKLMWSARLPSVPTLAAAACSMIGIAVLAVESFFLLAPFGYWPRRVLQEPCRRI